MEFLKERTLPNASLSSPRKPMASSIKYLEVPDSIVAIFDTQTGHSGCFGYNQGLKFNHLCQTGLDNAQR